MSFEEKFLERFVKELAKEGNDLSKAKEIARDFISYIKKKYGKSLYSFYNDEKDFRKLGEKCNEFVKEKNLKIDPFVFLNALKNASTDFSIETKIQSSIPAIMTGPGGNIDSKKVKEIKEKLKRRF